MFVVYKVNEQTRIRRCLGKHANLFNKKELEYQIEEYDLSGEILNLPINAVPESMVDHEKTKTYNTEDCWEKRDAMAREWDADVKFYERVPWHSYRARFGLREVKRVSHL